jgi:hypothetical protein
MSVSTVALGSVFGDPPFLTKAKMMVRCAEAGANGYGHDWVSPDIDSITVCPALPVPADSPE